jgi:tetratricopeptide (TPR) repeat protein
MRRAWISLLLVLAMAGAARAQMGKSVAVPAGSQEDKALSEIYDATDSKQKLELLDKFMAEYGKGDFAVLAYQLYFSTYQADKNFDKMFETGEKLLQLDPDSFSTAVALVRAAQEKNDSAKMFDYGQRAAEILKRYKAAPAPENAPGNWEQQKENTLKSAAEDMSYTGYTLFNAAYQTQDPAVKVALLERYATIFPDSPYTKNAEEAAVFVYQQLQNYPKMVETAQKALAAAPTNATLLLLLADYWSENGTQLDSAEANAKKALDQLAGAKKPEQVTEEQWKQQVTLQKGLAYSALGQVYVNRTRNAQAIDAFKSADPLLKSNTALYGRNLYRLGFTLAKMRRTAEAKVVLKEAIAVNSPYRALAQKTLDQISNPPR